MAHIRFATKFEVNGSTVDKLPVIITDTLKVHILSLKYFLHLRTSNQETSLTTYAQHIADFLSQLEACNEGLSFDHPDYVEWDEIDDNWLESYSNEILVRP